MSRHPLRKAAVIATLLGLAAQAALLLGVNADEVSRWAQVASLVVTALVSLGIVVPSEPQVTPMSDPRADDGTSLVAAPRFPGGV